MTVKEIITLASSLIGEEEVVKLNTGKAPEDSEYAEKTYKIIKNCYNIVNDELSGEYYPVKYSERVNLKDGKIMFSNFEKQPLRIISATDEKGNKLGYKLVNDYLDVNYKGDVTITYNYRPTVESDEEQAVYANNNIGPYVLCYGIISEYLLQKGNISESEIWQEKYMKGIRGKIAERRNLVIPERRW